MPKLRVHNFSISIDGYAAGPNQDVDNPLGVRGLALHEWVFKTRYWRQRAGEEGGDEGLDDKFLAAGDEGIGATVMGRNMFGPIRGAWKDEQWTGWWGDDPPYHHEVFVLTHHQHEPIPMQGGTTFNFVSDGIEAALARALKAADGKASGLVAAWPSFSSTCALASSTSCILRLFRCCWAAESGYLTASTVARSAMSASNS